ncbi:type II toxin-antitoxin system RatA family toxin [Saccharibacter sp. 17.LH.SD]|uniref:type II toxin-antitoxin system RatA family toxin n=1 Tax=Saccharibacter sp. 17.LH.SD TaxID=2689393 RepID=UPI0013688017|nr:type II toxin-antitoxin system RatA family toxin [Saccharibacter sp. 17.LH.SD]MXV44257.1 type II toxin-antitoxin system RatA family toxin [Saccharibacter sp. 17.LH.SD]
MPSHTEKRIIPYTPEQLFDLVADVGRYPEFLPWCKRAVVRSRNDNELLADLTVGFGPFSETYTSRIILERARRIVVTHERGPFKYLTNRWIFTPDERGCVVDFYVDFEFRSRLLSNAIGVVFNEGVRRMVKAFTARANRVYGPAVLQKKQNTNS